MTTIDTTSELQEKIYQQLAERGWSYIHLTEVYGELLTAAATLTNPASNDQQRQDATECINTHLAHVGGE